jgi:crotonobetainyl-CoA:carnitine CoA-transferase CaiB-like acyl-CoA transferase
VGSSATQILGDLGAEVIKIEEPVKGDPARSYHKTFGMDIGLPDGSGWLFECFNRNKRGITLNVKHKKAKEVIRRLIEKSDVFLQNYRKGAARRVGLDYQTLSRYNPQLIYASGTGYGIEGPDSEEPAFDLLAQARSGIMTRVGEPNMPPQIIMGPIGDQAAAVMLAFGVIGALLFRERKGFGQEIDASILGSLINLQYFHLSASLYFGQAPPRNYRSAQANAFFNYYRCGDGNWMVLAMLQTDRYWPDFCRALGLEHLINDPRFENDRVRQKNCRELISILDKTFLTKSYDEWAKILKESGDILFLKVSDFSDLPEDPQALANEYIVDYEHPALGLHKVLGCPVRFHRTPASVRMPAPGLGQHTDDVLRNVCDYSQDEINAMREDGVI